MNEEIVVAMRGLNSALRSIQKARSDALDMLAIWANRLPLDGTELTSPSVVEAENAVKERIKVLRAELQDSPDSAEIFAFILTEYESELETMLHVVGTFQFLLGQLKTEWDAVDLLLQRLTRFIENPDVC